MTAKRDDRQKRYDQKRYDRMHPDCQGAVISALVVDDAPTDYSTKPPSEPSSRLQLIGKIDPQYTQTVFRSMNPELDCETQTTSNGRLL
jgi:hypothetical protein